MQRAAASLPGSGVSPDSHQYYRRRRRRGSRGSAKHLVTLFEARKKKYLERYTTNTHHRRYTSRMHSFRIRTKNTQLRAKRPLQTRTTGQRTGGWLCPPLPRRRHLGQHARTIYHLRTSMLPLFHIRTYLRATTRVNLATPAWTRRRQGHRREYDTFMR